MLKKILFPYLLKSDKNTLLIAGECVPAGIEETALFIILQAALFEEINHKIVFTLRRSDHLSELINPKSLARKLYYPENCVKS
jgi:hypothetical protein